MQTLAHFAGIGAFLLRFERGSRFERGRTQPSLQYVETRDLRSQIVTSSYWREDESKIGIGGDASQLRPSHTTGHAGPHPAVRRVKRWVSRAIAESPASRSKNRTEEHTAEIQS